MTGFCHILLFKIPILSVFTEMTSFSSDFNATYFELKTSLKALFNLNQRFMV